MQCVFSILYYLISKSLWVSAVSYNTSNVTIIILISIKYTALCVHHHFLSYQRIVRNCSAAVNIRRLFVNLTELNWLSSSLNSLLSHMDNSFFFPLLSRTAFTPQQEFLKYHTQDRTCVKEPEHLVLQYFDDWKLAPVSQEHSCRCLSNNLAFWFLWCWSSTTRKWGPPSLWEK